MYPAKSNPTATRVLGKSARTGGLRGGIHPCGGIGILGFFAAVDSQRMLRGTATERFIEGRTLEYRTEHRNSEIGPCRLILKNIQ
jgi:hypothetical protein